MFVVAARRVGTGTALLFAVVTIIILMISPPTAGGGATADCAEVFDMNGSWLYLQASETARVEGIATLDPDVDVRLRVRFQDDRSPRVVGNESVYRDDRGRWRATVDLSDVAEGREFIATLERDGEVIEAVPGQVGRASATVTLKNQTVTTTAKTVTVRRVHLDLGGFVVIHEEEPKGRILGFSEYLSPGTHENVTVEMGVHPSPAGTTTLVAMPHYDSDCDQTFGFFYGTHSDGPYVASITPLQPVTDTATIQFPTPTHTPTPTETPNPTPTPTTTVRPPPSPTATPAPTPGFGLGAALIALVGAILLWQRL